MTTEAAGTTETPTPPTETPPQKPGPAADGIESRIDELKRRAAAGENVLEAAKSTARKEPDPVPTPVQPAEAGAEGEEEAPEDVEAPSLEDLKFENPYETQEGDPQGTYRDEVGRLRDQVTHRFVDEPGAGAEGTDGSEGAPETAPEGAEAPEDQPGDDGPIKLALPGRRPDDPEFELPIDREYLEAQGVDPDEAVERINQLRNEGLRRQELVTHLQRVETREAELDFIQQALSDPEAASDFILEHVSPDTQQQLARRLLAGLSDEQFEHVVELAYDWNRDPRGREAEAARNRAERYERREERSKELDTTRSDLQAAQQIQGAVVEMIPEDWPEVSTEGRMTKAQRFYQAAMTLVRDHIERNDLQRFGPDEVSDLLGRSGLLEDYGLSPNGDEPPSAPSAPSRPTRSAEEPRGRSPKAGGDAGKDLKARAERRKSAAATAPAGAGAASGARPQFEPGQHINDRIDAAKKALKEGRLKW